MKHDNNNNVHYLSEPAKSTNLSLPIVTILPPSELQTACSTIIVNTV